MNTDGLTVLTANVGNLDPRCAPVAFKLCRQSIEDRVGENLRTLSPDVVALQETLSDSLCDRMPFHDPGSACNSRTDEPQVRRMLGPDYSIVCEARGQVECIGVHVEAGEIVGCAPGALCYSDRSVDASLGCARNSGTFAATVQVRGRTFDVVNAHPDNRRTGCRLSTLEQLFEGPLLREENALLLGDFNLDPWRGTDESVAYWNRWVGNDTSRPFHYNSGIVESDPPYYTFQALLLRLTLDHVVSNFLSGNTVTLGEAPGTSRLDGGSGTDHRALYGELHFR